MFCLRPSVQVHASCCIRDSAASSILYMLSSLQQRPCLPSLFCQPKQLFLSLSSNPAVRCSLSVFYLAGWIPFSIWLDPVLYCLDSVPMPGFRSLMHTKYSLKYYQSTLLQLYRFLAGSHASWLRVHASRLCTIQVGAGGFFLGLIPCTMGASLWAFALTSKHLSLGMLFSLPAACRASACCSATLQGILVTLSAGPLCCLVTELWWVCWSRKGGHSRTTW
jgi:hypothetical protein